MHARRRVAVTGIGVVAAVRHRHATPFWDGLLGRRPEGERRVHDFDPRRYFDNPKEARRTDRFTQFALAAAHEALEQAGDLDADPRPRRRHRSAPASAASTPSRSRSSSTTRRAPAGSRRSWCR